MSYILVVDDERLVATSTAEILAGLLDPAPDVLAASSFAEAASLIQQRPGLDAILTDHDLGGDETGLELLALAKRYHPGATLALMSGNLCPDLAAAATRAGATTFLPKPFRPPELLLALFAEGRPAASLSGPRSAGRGASSAPRSS